MSGDDNAAIEQLLSSAVAWRILGQRRKSRVGVSGPAKLDIPPPNDPAGQTLVSPPLVSPGVAWQMLGNRLQKRLNDCKQQARKPNDEEQRIADAYLKNIDKINTLVSSQSVAEKAAASFSRARSQSSDAGLDKRRPSEGLFDFPLESVSKSASKDERRQSKVHFDLPVVESQSSGPSSGEGYSSASIAKGEVPFLEEGESEFGSDSSFSPPVDSESSKEPRSVSSQTSSGSDKRKSTRARKRDSVTIPTSPLSPCYRHSGRRRRFSSQAGPDAHDTDCTCRSRRRSSILFCPRMPDPTQYLNETDFPSVETACRRASMSSPTRVSPERRRKSSNTKLPFNEPSPAASMASRRTSDSYTRSRSSTMSTTCAISLFAMDLRNIASNIPAGDPRIGELYSAAARAFGPPSFISAPRNAPAYEESDESESGDDQFPVERSE
eukprot:CAMPEP_0181307532 /NCGR_PEP_ID=MMETSP1101-20121128/10939_1 /TAXON_ID=46948 /ORGANISM="Rhodomonas abbreviata, Strain Caron Lab Isolate" /LENGTH=437 /DNA_ID=CAMNT_0023413773 /DNA_START=71 /DNA_END=1384 /DNA_ORIENTATION=+